MRVLYDYGLNEEERNAVLEVLQGDKFAGDKQKRMLEQEFCEYIGSKYSVALSSGTAGLHCSLLACGVTRGDEVITVANTHWSPPMSIINAGAKPVLVDIDEETLNIDPSKIEEKITPKTKAIIPVHSSGHPYDIDPIHEIAEKHNLVVIEDAAQSLGAKYKGKLIGNRGDVTVFSFARHKHVMAGGWGGIVLTNTEELAEKVRMFASQGRGKKYYSEKSEKGVRKGIAEVSGFSYWLSEVHAAITRVQFRKFREGPLGVEKRRFNARIYNELLTELPFVKTPVEKAWARHSYLRYIVRVPNRDELYLFLRRKQIDVSTHYYVPIYEDEYFIKQVGPCTETFPVTSKTAKEVLTLPSWSQLRPEQIEYVVDSIKDFRGFQTSVHM